MVVRESCPAVTDFTHPDNFTDLWAYVSWQIMKGCWSPFLEGHVGEVCSGRNSFKRDATCAASLPPPRPAMSNAFKRDLRAGRMQPSRCRGDSKAERGAGEGRTAGGSCRQSWRFQWSNFHTAVPAAPLFLACVHTKDAGVPACTAAMRVAQLQLPPSLAVSIASQRSASLSRGHRSRTGHLISHHPATQLSSGPYLPTAGLASDAG